MEVFFMILMMVVPVFSLVSLIMALRLAGQVKALKDYCKTISQALAKNPQQAAFEQMQIGMM